MVSFGMVQILAADIGGTNSRFGVFTADDNGRLALKETCWLKTGEVLSFSELLTRLDGSGFPLRPREADISVFAVAGPVERFSKSSPPLIPWDIDLDRERDLLGTVQVLLINDFVSQAYAIRSPLGGKARTIINGSGFQDTTAAVVGAGTGLGKAAIVPDREGGFLVVASEGGHSSFPFETADEQRYHDFLKNKLGVRYGTGNHVVSGRGLSLLHEFLAGKCLGPEEIAASVGNYPDTLCWMARFYGRVCRNFALDTLALGGVYVAGGVAAKCPELVLNPAFATEFKSSDTMADILEAMTVFQMMDEDSGLWGSAMYGLLELGRKRTLTSRKNAE